MFTTKTGLDYLAIKKASALLKISVPFGFTLEAEEGSTQRVMGRTSRLVKDNDFELPIIIGENGKMVTPTELRVYINGFVLAVSHNTYYNFNIVSKEWEKIRHQIY